jgi:hypothetical protein
MREGVGQHLNCYPLLTSERLIATSIYSMTCYFAYFFARILDRLWSMTSSRLHRLIYAKLTHFHQKVASFHVVGSWLGILCKWQIIKTFPTLFLNFVDMRMRLRGHAGWTRAALDTLVVSQAATNSWATRYISSIMIASSESLTITTSLSISAALVVFPIFS